MVCYLSHDPVVCGYSSITSGSCYLKTMHFEEYTSIHRITESVRLEKTSQILRSNPAHPTIPTMSPSATYPPFWNTSRDGDSPTPWAAVAVPDHSLEKKLFLIPTLDLPLGNMRPSLLIMVPFTVLIMQRMARQQHGASNICSPSLPCVPTSVSGIWVPEPLDTSVRLRKREK